MKYTETVDGIPFTRTSNGVGNYPRYVVHFTSLLSLKEMREEGNVGVGFVSSLYEKAIKKAKEIGGKKYDTKHFGGGIVFKSCSLKLLAALIKTVRDERNRLH